MATTSTYGDFEVQNVRVLQEPDCAGVVDAVESLQRHWIQRQPAVPFYTLGASNSYDIPNLDPPPYFGLAQRLNPLLRENLGWFYGCLSEALAQHLGAEVEFPDEMAMPGFHIILPDERLDHLEPVTHRQWFAERQTARSGQSPVHADIPHFLVEWEARDQMDFTSPLSFTLPVSVPEGGTGMFLWDLSYDEGARMSEMELKQAYREREKWVHPYRLGEMTLHDGLFHHQAIPFLSEGATHPRITLQGHGLKRNETWQIYW